MILKSLMNVYLYKNEIQIKMKNKFIRKFWKKIIFHLLKIIYL